MSKYNSKCPLNCNKKGCGINLCQRYADYQQGARDFAEWWFNKPEATNPNFDKWMDVFIAEWQKGQTDGENKS